MNWIITQDMMDRACAIFTQETGNPLRDAKRIEAQEPIKHTHKWVRTVALESNVYRCISCGEWNKEQVQWGVDWGKQGDRTAVSIVKHHPDGTMEVVAIEVEPAPTFTTEPAASVRLVSRTNTSKRVEFDAIPWDGLMSMADGRMWYACPICSGALTGPMDGGPVMVHKECIELAKETE